MTANDKCGIGAGLLAVGLGGGLILLEQFAPELFVSLGLFNPREVADTETLSAVLSAGDLKTALAILDIVVLLLGVPSGIYFLYKGATSDGPTNKK